MSTFSQSVAAQWRPVEMESSVYLLDLKDDRSRPQSGLAVIFDVLEISQST